MKDPTNSITYAKMFAAANRNCSEEGSRSYLNNLTNKGCNCYSLLLTVSTNKLSQTKTDILFQDYCFKIIGVKY